MIALFDILYAADEFMVYFRFSFLSKMVNSFVWQTQAILFIQLQASYI